MQKSTALQEALSKINFKNPIEKSYVSSFLINYFDVQNSKKIRQEMLLTLSNILDFSESEKKKIGIF